MDVEKLIGELYELKQKEKYTSQLSGVEEARYTELVTLLQNAGVEIPFAVIE